MNLASKSIGNTRIQMQRNGVVFTVTTMRNGKYQGKSACFATLKDATREYLRRVREIEP